MARRRRPRHGTIVAYLALFVSLGGSAYAAVKVTGRNVVNSSLTGADVRNNSLTGADVRGLTAQDFRGGLPAGAPGPAGPAGAPGAAGPAGPPGANGSPDSAQQVLGKLATVDGPGSGLDADLLDGVNAADLQRGSGRVIGGSADLTGVFDLGTVSTTLLEVPGELRVTASCRNNGPAGAWVTLANLQSSEMLVVRDQGGADPASGQPVVLDQNEEDDSPAAAADRVTWIVRYGTREATIEVGHYGLQQGSLTHCDFIGQATTS